jgi:alpha-D-ribose 1-methylphosphonate 5-triphosphate synthase subunit PhnH
MDNSVNDKAMDARSMEGGFSDPVFDAQRVFDSIMNAMARPGSIAEIEILASAPEPLFPTTSAILATLCDTDTSVWFDSANESSAFGEWLSFQTGAMLVYEREMADFAIVCNLDEMPNLGSFSQGTQEYPDRSATLIIQVKSIGSGAELSLRGPGIKSTTGLLIEGISSNFVAQWQINRKAFPLGVDVILASPSTFVCLPRTVRLSDATKEGAL